MKIIGNENRIQVLKNKENNYSQDGDRQIALLNKQKDSLKKRLSEIGENQSLSLEQKKSLKEHLNKEIESIEREIVERELEIKNEVKKERELKGKDTVDYKGNEDRQQETNLLKVTDSLEKIKTQYKTKVEMKGEAKVMAGEIKLDESRGQVVSDKKESLATLENKIQKLSKKISTNMRKVGEELKKGEKKAVDKKEKTEKIYTVNTDKVDREIEALRKKHEDLLSRGTGEGLNEKEEKELKLELEKLEAELLEKDNEAYRRNKAEKY